MRKKKTARVISFLMSVTMLASLLCASAIDAKTESQSVPVSLAFLYGNDTMAIYTENVDRTKGYVNQVSPDFFTLQAGDSSGTVKLVQTVERNTKFIEDMHAKNIKVLPTVTSLFDKAVGEAALDARESLSQTLADFVKNEKLDGLVIDIDNLTETSKTTFTTFISLLKDRMPKDTLLTIAVPPNPKDVKTGNVAAYDYKELTKKADYFFLKSYDEHSLYSDAGPVASINFVTDSVTNAIASGIPNNKLLLGIQLYGRIWKKGYTAPASIKVTATPGDASVKLDWSAVSGATKYQIFVNDETTPAVDDISPVELTKSVTKLASGASLVNGTEYTFYVRALSGTDVIFKSTGVKATPNKIPDTPTGFAAAPGNTAILLTWTAAPLATGYKIYDVTNAQAETLVATIASGATVTYTVTDLTNDTPYSYKISATNTLGESAKSAAVTETPNASAQIFAGPKAPTAVAGDKQVTLKWEAAVDASKYRIYVNEAANPIVEVAATTTPLEYTVTNLTNDVEYTFYISTVVGTTESDKSPSVKATPKAPTKPDKPATLEATPRDKSVELFWAASPGATSYKIYRNSDTNLIGTVTSGRVFTATGLTNDVLYTFYVSAVNSIGESDKVSVTATPKALGAAEAVPGSGNGIGTGDIKSIMSMKSLSATFDSVAKSPSITLTVKKDEKIPIWGNRVITEGEYTIWYENDQSWEEKLALVRSKNLAGVGEWALGQEPDTFWSSFRSWLVGLPFTDIQDNWAQQYIVSLYDMGIVSGMTTNSFDPSGLLTRAQAATMMVRMAGLSNVEPNSSFDFTDSRTHWARKEIALAHEFKLIGGYTDNTFKPDKLVSREEFAQIASNYTNTPATVDFSEKIYDDVSSTLTWANDSIIKMSKLHVFNGRSERMFAPKEYVTRAEAAKIITLTSELATNIDPSKIRPSTNGIETR